MITPTWCKPFKHNYDLDKLLVCARKFMLNNKSVSGETYPLLGKTLYWDGRYGDDYVKEVAEDLQKKFNVPLMFDGNYVSYWEYNEGDDLIPHKDPNISQSMPIIISLIGGFTVRLNDEDTNEVLDEVTYYPGEGIFLNNTQKQHSGDTTDGYRLALILPVQPGFDLESFFKGD